MGACVGPNGSRVRAVVEELSGERVDVVPWSDDAATLVGNALRPARVTGVSIDQELRTASVQVPAGQLSLAIGKDGQNARLAARLTGWRIDIRAAEEDVASDGNRGTANGRPAVAPAPAHASLEAQEPRVQAERERE